MANEFKVKKGLIVSGSGGTLLDVQGSVGQVFSAVDSLTGDIFSVSDVSGIPIFNVNSSGLSTFDGDASFTGAVTATGGLIVDTQFKYDTDTGNQPFYITRSGGTDQALSIKVMDDHVRFESIQDETADDYGGFDFRMDSGATEPDFIIRKGTAEPLFNLRGDGNATFAGNVKIADDYDINLFNSDITNSTGQINLARSGAITFYGNSGYEHSITSRDADFNASDDLRINSFGAVYINLDSNNNNTSNANFMIGRHGAVSTISDWLFKIDGETGNVGIGTDDPTHLLTLEETDTNSVQLVIDNFNTSDAGTETSTIRFRHYRSYVAGLNDAGEITLGKEQAWDAAGDRNSYMSFGTRKGSDGVAEKMRITSDGNVGISATDPLRTLHVAGDFAVNAATDQYYGVYINGTGEGADPSILIGDWHNSSASIKWDSGGNYLNIDSQHSTSGAPIVFTGNDSAIEYMRITSTGVGISTDDPQTYLQIGDYPSNNIDITTYPNVPSEHMIHLTAPETTSRYGAGISFGENGFTAANITVQDAGGNGSLHMLFGTRDTSGIVQERMRIDSSGDITFENNITAGTSGEFNVRGGGYIQLGNCTISKSGDSNHIHVNCPTALIPNSQTLANNTRLGTSAYRWQNFYSGPGNFEGSVTASADVIAYSDVRLKENVKTLDGSKVLQMRGVSFDRKDTGASSSGVIAQELQKVAPELVSDDDGTLGVAYGNLTGYLIEAIKDLKQEIEQLKKQINNG